MEILIQNVIYCNEEGGQRPSEGPTGPWRPEGLMSPLLELEGGAWSVPKF